MPRLARRAAFLLPLLLLLAGLLAWPARSASAQSRAAAPASAAGAGAPAAPAASAADGKPEPRGAAASPATAPAAAPQPIAVSDIAVQAEAAATQLREVRARLDADATAREAGGEIGALARDLEARAAELRELLARDPSLDALRQQDVAWAELGRRSTALTRGLTERAEQLDQEIEALRTMAETWQLTATSAAAAGVPPELAQRARQTLEQVSRLRAEASERRTRVLSLQTRAADLGGRIGEQRAALEAAIARGASRLLLRDSPPLWAPDLRARSARQLALDEGDDLARQAAALAAYTAQHRGLLLLHAALAAALVAGAYWARRSAHRRVADDAPVAQALAVFDSPIAAGVLVALFASPGFHPQAPPLGWALLSLAGTLPTVTLLRRLLTPALFPALYAVVGLFAAEQLRSVVSATPPLARGVLALEALVAIVMLLWYGRAARRAREQGGAATTLAWRVLRALAWPMALVFAATLALNAAGYVRLAEVVGSGAVRSAYVALALGAFAGVGEGVVAGLMRLRPFSALLMVRLHRAQLVRRLTRWLRWGAFAAWLLVTLSLFSLYGTLSEAVGSLLETPLRAGSLAFRVGDVVSFGLIVWAAFAASRLLRFVLEEEVFPKLALGRGVPYAVSAVLHYAVLLLGFVAALAALGIDMTKFTLLASAFGVGVGFGMQNIVNNFVSGLIVLFERPVKVGDLVQVGTTTGRVERIGIRASVLRLPDGPEAIIPNSRLVSDQVTNWTLTSRMRQLQLPLTASLAADPARVSGLLLTVAHRHPRIVDAPAPAALFTRIGPDVLEFELRAWTDDLEGWARVRSELTSAAHAAMREADIAFK